MQVREGMSETVLTIGPRHTLRDAAEAMCRRNVGAAVVLDPEAQGPGVITERDILRAVGCGRGPGSGAGGRSPDRGPDLRLAGLVARAGGGRDGKGRFRHLVVVDGGELAGILSMRDIVRCWTQDGATSEVPAPAAT